MPAIFTVDPRSGVPLYLQLIEQIKRSVALGVLARGEQLPTVKQMATDLTVNPNTVARAYRDLEREGVIETSPGRGSFVRSLAADGSANTRAASDVLAASLGIAVREARAMGISRRDLADAFERALARWYAGESTEASSE